MNLYLISQTKNNDYDTYDSAVVAAENEEAARNTHPSGDNIRWDDMYTWAAPQHVIVQYIGVAASDVIAGVVCASFNAG